MRFAFVIPGEDEIELDVDQMITGFDLLLLLYKKGFIQTRNIEFFSNGSSLSPSYPLKELEEGDFVVLQSLDIGSPDFIERGFDHIIQTQKRKNAEIEAIQRAAAEVLRATDADKSSYSFLDFHNNPKIIQRISHLLHNDPAVKLALMEYAEDRKVTPGLEPSTFLNSLFSILDCPLNSEEDEFQAFMEGLSLEEQRQFHSYPESLLRKAAADAEYDLNTFLHSIMNEQSSEA